jgi:hypothetical protein
MVEGRECYGQYDIRYYNFEDLSKVRLTGVNRETLKMKHILGE